MALPLILPPAPPSLIRAATPNIIKPVLDLDLKKKAIFFPAPFGALGGVIGVPTLIATKAQASAASASTTTTAAINAGDLVVALCIESSVAAYNVSSFTDGTNTYVKAVSQNSGGNQNSEIWYCANASAVAAGATVTMNLPGGTGGGGNGLGFRLYTVSGIAASSPLDKTAGSTTLAVATAALAQANEIGFAVGEEQNGTSYTESSGWTTLAGPFLYTGTASFYGFCSYFLSSSTAALSWNPTIGGTTNSPSYVIASFKGA